MTCEIFKHLISFLAMKLWNSILGCVSGRNFLGSEDVLIDWEDQVFHDLDLLSLCENLELTPIMWPRDTLFLFYILMESLSWNIDERDILLDNISKRCDAYTMISDLRN